MANTNIAPTGAICCTPVTMNLAVASPKPAASAAATGTVISATSGDASRLTMSTNRVATVRKPRNASTGSKSHYRVASAGQDHQIGVPLHLGLYLLRMPFARNEGQAIWRTRRYQNDTSQVVVQE